MNSFLFEKISNLIKTSILIVDGYDNIVFENKDIFCPIKESREFIIYLQENAKKQNSPLIYRDEYDVCFACLVKDNQTLIIGPIATKHLDKVTRHKFYRRFNIKEENETTITEMFLGEILNTVELVASVFMGEKYSDEQLIRDNAIEETVTSTLDSDKYEYTLNVDEEDIYRHTYREERMLLDMVREGNIEEALNRTRKMDGDIGKLSNNDIEHWKNLMVIATTLCARAAIDGGVAPYVAYRLSGFYINKGTSCDDVFKIITYRNHAVEELVRLVKEQKEKRHTSSYTEQTKDFVKQHYREKIYLEKLAEKLRISSSYLSRLFKKETGINLQEYIIQVRLEKAANLLTYSEESIPRIAEYVNFPSQSYFGNLFKSNFGITPRQYREKYKPAEFLEIKE